MENRKKSLVDRFDEDYFLPETRNHASYPKAFEAAAEKFEVEHKFEPPFNYDAFRMRKVRKRKTRR